MRTCFEGPDGVGKTTRALAYAENTGCTYVRCPGYTQLGEFLRPVLKDCRRLGEIQRAGLFALVDHDAARLAPENAVFDRNGISGVIYRMAAGDTRALALLRELIKFDELFLTPANCATVVMDCPDAVLDQRMGIRGDETDEGSFFRTGVRRLYRDLCNKCGVMEIPSGDDVTRLTLLQNDKAKAWCLTAHPSLTLAGDQIK